MSQCIPDQPEPAQCSVVTVAASRRVVATNGTAARRPHCYNVARRRSHAAILPCSGLLAGSIRGYQVLPRCVQCIVHAGQLET